MPMDKMSYSAGASNTHGKGGTMAAAKRNPNKKVSLNDSPCGPYAHFLGEGEDYSGMVGDTTVSHRGRTYNFK